MAMAFLVYGKSVTTVIHTSRLWSLAKSVPTNIDTGP